MSEAKNETIDHTRETQIAGQEGNPTIYDEFMEDVKSGIAHDKSFVEWDQDRNERSAARWYSHVRPYGEAQIAYDESPEDTAERGKADIDESLLMDADHAVALDRRTSKAQPTEDDIAYYKWLKTDAPAEQRESGKKESTLVDSPDNTTDLVDGRVEITEADEPTIEMDPIVAEGVRPDTPELRKLRQGAIGHLIEVRQQIHERAKKNGGKMKALERATLREIGLVMGNGTNGHYELFINMTPKQAKFINDKDMSYEEVLAYLRRFEAVPYNVRRAVEDGKLNDELYQEAVEGFKELKKANSTKLKLHMAAMAWIKTRWDKSGANKKIAEARQSGKEKDEKDRRKWLLYPVGALAVAAAGYGLYKLGGLLSGDGLEADIPEKPPRKPPTPPTVPPVAPPEPIPIPPQTTG
jgi:hypothetical protein